MVSNAYWTLQFVFLVQLFQRIVIMALKEKELLWQPELNWFENLPGSVILETQPQKLAQCQHV